MRKRHLLYIGLVGLLSVIMMLTLNACVDKGCTDPYASNYDPDADEDDGSCVYDEPKYATLTIFRYGECYEGRVDLYMNGYFQKTFATPYGSSYWPDCGAGGTAVISMWLELGYYHFTAYADSNVVWDFHVNLSDENGCYVAALKCGGVADGDGVSNKPGTGNLVVYSSFDFGNDISVKINGVTRGVIRDYYTYVPWCGDVGCLSLANLSPGVYQIDATNGTYTWANYSVLVRDGWCNSFELK